MRINRGSLIAGLVMLYVAVVLLNVSHGNGTLNATTLAGWAWYNAVFLHMMTSYLSTRLPGAGAAIAALVLLGRVGRGPIR